MNQNQIPSKVEEAQESRIGKLAETLIGKLAVAKDEIFNSAKLVVASGLIATAAIGSTMAETTEMKVPTAASISEGFKSVTDFIQTQGYAKPMEMAKEGFDAFLKNGDKVNESLVSLFESGRKFVDDALTSKKSEEKVISPLKASDFHFCFSQKAVDEKMASKDDPATCENYKNASPEQREIDQAALIISVLRGESKKKIILHL